MAYPTVEARLKSRLEAGLRAHRAGDIQGALDAYRQVLAAEPDHPAALGLLGTALLQLGEAGEAVSVLERAARLQSADPRLLANLAQAYLALERYADAGRIFREASRLAPNEAQFHVGVAVALAMGGNVDEAAALLERLAARFPDAPLVWFNLGNVRRDRGQSAKAIQAYRRALELDPQMIEARNSVGSIFHSQERFAEAETEYRLCVAAAPHYSKALYNLASLLMDRARFTEAEEMWRALVGQSPADADAQRLLGTALGQQKRLLEALACYRRAASLAPNDAAAAQAYGGGLMESGYAAAGLRWLARAACCDPRSVPLKRVTAGALLAHGCLQDAWTYHAARSGAAELRSIHGAWDPDETPTPRLSGSHVCVIGEQGLGDELFFLRYGPRLSAIAKHITYRTSARLESLLQRAPGLQAMRAEGAQSQRPDVHVLAGDMPLALGNAEQSALQPGEVAQPDVGLIEPPRSIAIFWPLPPPPLAIPPLPQRIEEMRARLAAVGPPPYFGVTWRAGISPEHQKGATAVLFKAIGLRELAQALHGLPGSIVSLQRTPAPGENDALAGALERPVHDFSAVNDDLEGMLAVLALLDDYVGVSNTNMHLRAAAGRTARVLVPVPAEWRWLQSGRFSPWFPGFAVYRQSLQGDWSAALRALARDLKAEHRGA